MATRVHAFVTWQGLCQGVLCVHWNVLFYPTVVKAVATILRLPPAGLLNVEFSLLAVRPIRFNHMADIVPHGLGSVNSFLHTYITRFEGSQLKTPNSVSTSAMQISYGLYVLCFLAKSGKWKLEFTKKRHLPEKNH